MKDVKNKAGKVAKSVNAGKPATGAQGRKKVTESRKAPGAKRELAGQHFNASEAVLAYGEVFSMEDARQIAALDLRLGVVSTDPDYVKANTWQYYLGINTWYLLIADLRVQDDPRGRAARTLISLIRQIGLTATIALCCDTAQKIVQGLPTPERMKFLIVDDLQVTLQSLRYLKRFTVLKADLIEGDNLKSWLRIEKSCKHFNCRNYVLNSKYDYVMSRIRATLQAWLADYVPVKVDDDLPPVPSGATFELEDGKSLSLSERMRRYARAAHNGRRFVFNCADPSWDTPQEPRYKLEWDVDLEWNYESTDVMEKRSANGWSVSQVSDPTHSMATPTGHVYGGVRYGKSFLTVRVRRYYVLRDLRKNRLLFVPKNYKTYRTVCPESPLNQMMQRKIRDHVWEALPAWVKEHLPLHDQTVMEALAACGVALNLSTTDLSHASDSFSVRVFGDAFPADVVRDVFRWRPTHTIIKGVAEPHTLQQLSTMGTGNVWLLMAVFLLACMVVACELGRVPDTRTNGCFAFGDDLIHPSEVTDILYWILQLMGFEVNAEKSYGGANPYRESCGSEWWQNPDGSVTSLRTLYYPRFPVAQGGQLCDIHWDYKVDKDQYEPVDGLSRLIQLQHSLYYLAPSAAEFLARAVKRLMPQMTTSLAGTPCDDLWGEVESGPIRDMPQLFAADDRFKHPVTWFDPELNAEVPVTTRMGHMQLMVGCAENRLDAIQTEWLYLQFLQHGPKPVEDSWMPCNATERQRLLDPQTLTVKWKVKF